MISRVSDISFKSTPIYDVKVKKKEGEGYKTVNAVFSKLNPNDNEDIRAMYEIYGEWGRYGGEWTEDIVEAFYKRPDEDIYAIELKGDKPLCERIITLADVIPIPRFRECFIAFMQSKPYNPWGEEAGKPHFSGGGETMLYGIIQNAIKNGCKRVETFLEGDSDFYEYMGFRLSDNGRAFLPKKDFKSFTSRVEKKYAFLNKGEKK